MHANDWVLRFPALQITPFSRFCIFSRSIIVLCLGDTIPVGLIVGLNIAFIIIIIVIVIIVVVVILTRLRSRLCRFRFHLNFPYFITFASSSCLVVIHVV